MRTVANAYGEMLAQCTRCTCSLLLSQAVRNQVKILGADRTLSKVEKGSALRSTLMKRFWDKVEKTAGCWLWRATSNDRGYGQFRCVDGKQRGAHRVSWEMHFGTIPPGFFVCHKCDVPLCVNPEHLFLGTNTDNIQDMYCKGRQGSCNTKITALQADALRAFVWTGVVSQKDLGCLLGVDQSTVSYRLRHPKKLRA